MLIEISRAQTKDEIDPNLVEKAATIFKDIASKVPVRKSMKKKLQTQDSFKEDSDGGPEIN